MSASSQSLFRIDVGADSPRIIGTSWWNDAVKEFAAINLGRRQLVTAGGTLLGLWLVGRSCPGTSGGVTMLEPRNALELQRTYGWSFGAPEDARTVQIVGTEPMNRDALARLVADLQPKRQDLQPYAVNTLFDSLITPPSRKAAEEPQAPSLADVLWTSPQDARPDVEEAGRLAAELVKGVPGALMIVDLPGKKTVAFAAGAARSFDPVFLFDNWPHPRGVVRSHFTLAAAATYQSTFVARARERAPTAPPMFVLDRERLSPYSDDASQFDNRYVAKVPPRAALQQLGIKNVVYVSEALPECDDLNDDFSWWVAGNIAVHSLLLSELLPAAPASSLQPRYAAPPLEAARTLFQEDHGLLPADETGSAPSSAPSRYAVRPRPTLFSNQLVPSEPTEQVPMGFGNALVALQQGRVLGGGMWRNGSWNRVTSSSSWGGG